MGQDEGMLFDTPAGKQPYHDFWVSNAWVPDAQYNGTVYGQYGEWVKDTGSGTYDLSDFHHNGDLIDYFDPWQINYGAWVMQYSSCIQNFGGCPVLCNEFVMNDIDCLLF